MEKPGSCFLIVGRVGGVSVESEFLRRNVGHRLNLYLKCRYSGNGFFLRILLAEMGYMVSLYISNVV